MSKESGLAVLKKYGVEYFKKLRKKVKRESLVKSGRKGGQKIKEKYGNEYIKKIAKRGREKFRKRIKTDKRLKEIYRKTFIKRMKKFTKIHSTKTGIKVRSKLEQQIADFLTDNNIHFTYESLTISTKFGNYQPDFVVGNKIIEVFGMDADFYIKKKTRKLLEAIKNNPQFKWIIFVNFNIPSSLRNCNIVKTKRQLLTFVQEKELLNP